MSRKDADALAEDAIRRRAYQIWEEEGRPEGLQDEHWRRARDELRRAFETATEHVGEHPHRFEPPLEIEEALTPGLSRKPGGMKLARPRKKKE